MTTVRDGEVLAEHTRNVALDYLALGLSPDKAVFYRQSDVPQVAELAWVLSCVTGKGLLDRATSFKDKVNKGITPNVGLYFYPVLMAADILFCRSHLVPVGKDQQQHLEMTRDMATYFNEQYGREVFPLPEPRYNKRAKVPGTTKDESGEFQKMSKSYDNTIGIFLEGKPLKKKIMSIETDSTPVEDPKNPEKCIVFALYELFATDDEKEEMSSRYRAGGMGYGDAKKALLAKVDAYFADARERRKTLSEDTGFVDDVLHAGATRARELADETMDIVRDVTGLGTRFTAR